MHPKQAFSEVKMCLKGGWVGAKSQQSPPLLGWNYYTWRIVGNVLEMTKVSFNYLFYNHDYFMVDLFIVF